MQPGVLEFTSHFPTSDYSTSIEEVWYNENRQRMTVSFKTGGLYSYDEVSPQLLADFINSDSLGGFFAEYFRQWTGPGEKHIPGSVIFKKVQVISTETGAEYDWIVRYTGTVIIRARTVSEAVAKFNEAFPDQTAVHLSTDLPG